ncbi:MAG TPA: PEGA domain-containing protein [Thermoanaerobaculia bacterium]|nr:PEGA domain-containing protein [Thermoanaerobaculia bacterium]
MKVLIVGLGLVLSIGVAHADRPKVADDKPLDKTQQAAWDRGVSTEQMQAAAAAFDEANAQLDASLPSKAVDKYSEALKLWPHPMIHYNMALALIDLKRPVEVAEHLEKAIQYGVEGLNGQQDKLDQAKRLLEFTLDQLATLEVSCQKEGAKVTIDGKHVFTVEKGKPNSFKGRVPIGKHTFVAEKPGYATSVDAPLIDKRETFRIELKLYTAEELTRYHRRWETRRWAPWAVVGGGAVVGIVGGILQSSASSSYRDFESKVQRCSQDAMNGSCDASQFSNLRDSGDTKRTLGYIGYGVAGAAIATGGLLVFLNRRVAYQITTDEYRMEEIRKVQAQQKAVSITPLVGPGVGGAAVMGRF